MEWQDRCLQEHKLLRTLFALEYLRHSPYNACKASKGLGSREVEGGCKVKTRKDVVADGAAGSEECEVIVADVVDGVVVDSGVDVQGALTFPLSDFVDAGLAFFIERANVHGVSVDFDA